VQRRGIKIIKLGGKSKGKSEAKLTSTPIQTTPLLTTPSRGRESTHRPTHQSATVCFWPVGLQRTDLHPAINLSSPPFDRPYLDLNPRVFMYKASPRRPAAEELFNVTERLLHLPVSRALWL